MAAELDILVLINLFDRNIILHDLLFQLHSILRGSYGQKDVFYAISLDTLPLIGHDSMMCKDQEYV